MCWSGGHKYDLRKLVVQAGNRRIHIAQGTKKCDIASPVCPLKPLVSRHFIYVGWTINNSELAHALATFVFIHESSYLHNRFRSQSLFLNVHSVLFFMPVFAKKCLKRSCSKNITGKAISLCRLNFHLNAFHYLFLLISHGMLLLLLNTRWLKTVSVRIV